jgi:hypothetical protein
MGIHPNWGCYSIFFFLDRQGKTRSVKIEKATDNRRRAISLGKVVKIAVAASALWTILTAKRCPFFWGCLFVSFLGKMGGAQTLSWKVVMKWP